MKFSLNKYLSLLPGRFAKKSDISYHVKVPGKPGHDAIFETRGLARIHKRSLAESRAHHKATIIRHEISSEGLIVDTEVS
jgi:hypothetical protein